ncbi:MAG: PAS domain-containing protein [Pseudomonadota bacterium]
MASHEDWVKGVAAAVTVTAADGTIVDMNPGSRETFAADGGAALIGRSVFDCHSPESRQKLSEFYRTRQPNHYTIRKNGRRKIIHQLPWYKDGRFAGIVELSIPIPDDLPHFERDAT